MQEINRIIHLKPKTPVSRTTDAGFFPMGFKIMPILKLLRLPQWIKNGFVLMPLIFSGRLLHGEDVFRVCAMLAAFCLASSITYVINDYMDMDQDRVHPLKKNRPLASGEVSPLIAVVIVLVLLGIMITLGVAAAISKWGFIILAIYLGLHVLYSVKLKDVVILDVLAISAGFLLRVIAGASVISIGVSSWLILCTFSISIFLALGKRRHEVVVLCEDAQCHRPVLESYSVLLLDQLLQVVTTSTLIFYCLYSVSGAGIHSDKMMFTIPLVTYGIFRYMYLIYQQENGGSPTALLLTDPPLLTCVTIWIIACISIIYYH